MSFEPTAPIPKAIHALVNATVDFANGGPASDLASLWSDARRAVESEIAEAVAAEREACARIVDGWRAFKSSSDMADSIRARGK